MSILLIQFVLRVQKAHLHRCALKHSSLSSARGKPASNLSQLKQGYNIFSCHRNCQLLQFYNLQLIVLSCKNYFIQGVLRKRGLCFRLVKYCVQASLVENKIQIDLSSLDAFSFRRKINENLSTTLITVFLKRMNVIYKFYINIFLCFES